MENSTHEKRLKKIEAECAELRRQILKLEFQNKKDIFSFRKESDERWLRFEKISDRTQRHLDHLSQLTGIAFDTFEDLDDRLDAESKPLARKRQRTD
ncbi:MAG: hypothetical protein IPN69_19705 [Acidobacteria bacterium]|nr:hypothetical protein [Acidobacteriota bacterium]